MSQIVRHDGEAQAASEWDYIVKVVLMSGDNLIPMDDNGLSDPYVRFKLQNDKYKTKVCANGCFAFILLSFCFHSFCFAFILSFVSDFGDFFL